MLLPLLRAAHIGPGLAVTTAVAVLAAASDLAWATGILVTAGVFCGQLTIGWGNDLLDAGRDRQVGRADKPIATRRISERLVLGCLVAAAVACVVLSFAAGWRSGLVHLLLGVAWGHAYNLGLKATAFSWLPYGIAFGSLPAVVSLAGSSPDAPRWSVVIAAVAVGIGAHLLNALPDLVDDAATGVHGLPLRLGERRTRLLATVLLLAASASVVLGYQGGAPAWAWGAVAAVVVLAVLALVGRGKTPFRAAIAIALIDVVLLAAGAR